MPNATLLSATLALLLCTGAAAAGQRTLIRAGQVIDVDNAVVLQDQAILIDSGRIVSLQAYRAGLAEGIKVLDWSAYTVSPGFMDMHTHLAGDLLNFSTEAFLKAKPEDDQLRRQQAC